MKLLQIKFQKKKYSSSAFYVSSKKLLYEWSNSYEKDVDLQETKSHKSNKSNSIQSQYMIFVQLPRT